MYFTGFAPFVLSRVPATGGGSEAVEIVTDLLERETVHAVFKIFPGGKMGIFQVWYATTGEDAEVWAIDLDTGERRFLIAGNNPSYASTGHLFFGTPDGALMAAPIDPGTAELSGPPVPVAEGLVVSPAVGTVNYAVSESGTLIYSVGSAGARAGIAELVWVTRSGDAAPVDPSWQFDPPPAALAVGWRLSPDGARVALTNMVDGNVDIWIKQLPEGPLERLTFDNADERYPGWTPDGRFVTYVKDAEGNYDAWQSRADGTGAPELLLDDERSLLQFRWSPDGEWMVFRAGGILAPIGERDVVGFRSGEDSATIPLVATAEFAEYDPALSPDGRWLAYTSNETGRADVYVRPFPDVESDKVRVSTDGGSGPLWAHSGTELFFVDAGRSLIAAGVETTSGFRVLERETLFALGSEYLLGAASDFYDIAPDDQQFLMARLASTAFTGEGRLVLVVNFFEELLERAEN